MPNQKQIKKTLILHPKKKNILNPPPHMPSWNKLRIRQVLNVELFGNHTHIYTHKQHIDF